MKYNESIEEKVGEDKNMVNEDQKHDVVLLMLLWIDHKNMEEMVMEFVKDSQPPIAKIGWVRMLRNELETNSRRKRRSRILWSLQN